MRYVGHCINLDRSPDRRAAMKAQLARLNPAGRYHRFLAVDGNPLGIPSPDLAPMQTGCFTSHYLLLQMHLDQADHLHIVEEDAVLADKETGSPNRLHARIAGFFTIDDFRIF
jgi:GR25 family glycosyltransferase involved in LPS biosynthesis